MESVGQKLRDARTRLGLTLDQISAETRISLKNLTAIESDDLSAINSRFFYRSFVRQFAGKVGTDFSLITAAVEQAIATMPEPLMPGQAEVPVVRVPPMKRKRQWNLRWVSPLFSFLLVTASCTALFDVWQGSRGNVHILMNTVSLRLKSASDKLGLKSASDKLGLTSGPAKLGLTSDPAKLSARSAIEHQPQVAALEFHIQLSALERTWLSIVADGNETFSGILNAAQTKAFEGRESARVKTRNAGGLNIVFNGKNLGILGSRGEVCTVVFTRNSYEVLSTPSHPSPTPLALTTLIQSGE